MYLFIYLAFFVIIYFLFKLSAFRYSAWEWSEERKQFYLHQYLKEQPDLNYRNPEVVEEMNVSNMLHFIISIDWLYVY